MQTSPLFPPRPPGRFLLSPSSCLDEHLLQFKFLGILMGVAIRTKKPLDLHLAPMVWKQLCCIPLLLEDLEEVDLLYVQTLNSILHIEDSGITEENFHEVGATHQGCGATGDWLRWSCVSLRGLSTIG